MIIVCIYLTSDDNISCMIRTNLSMIKWDVWFTFFVHQLNIIFTCFVRWVIIIALRTFQTPFISGILWPVPGFIFISSKICRFIHILKKNILYYFSFKWNLPRNFEITYLSYKPIYISSYHLTNNWILAVLYIWFIGLMVIFFRINEIK